MPKCCVLAGTSWYVETFIWVVVTCVGFPIAFGNDRLEKPVNMRDTNYVTPPHCRRYCFFLPFPVTSDFAMYIRKPRISGAVLVEARSMTYGDLGAKAFLSVLVVVSH